MPSIKPYATNPHGVTVQPLNFDAPGAPTIKTYHGLSIVVNGAVVGRIQSWQPQMYSRGGVHVYELNNNTYGRPVDYVPGKANNFTASVSRMEVWHEEFEIALGFPVVWNDLVDQNTPFTVQEYLFRGSAVYRVWSYFGCWFTDRNEGGFEAGGDSPQITASGSIAFVSRIRTT